MTPKIRFKGFSDNWKSIQLKQISKRITRKNKDLTSELPLTISAQYGLVDQKEFFNKVVASSNLTNYILIKKGEFAYNKSYSKGYPFGAIKRLNRYKYGALSTLYIVFKLSNNVSSNFFEQYYNSNYWYKEVYRVSAEGARNHGLLNISSSDFFDSKLSIPSTKEQSKIGDLLSLIDNKINKQQEKLSSLELIKEGYLQKLFPITNENKPKLRFERFSDNWQCKSLDEIATIRNGGAFKSEMFTNNGIPIVRISNVLKSGNIGGIFANYKEDNKFKKYELKNNSILIAMSGATVGKTSILKSNKTFYQNQRIGFIKPKKHFNNYFIYNLLKTDMFKLNMERIKVSGAQPNISSGDIGKFVFKITKIKEQEMISELMSLIDKHINLQKKELEQLNLLKKGYLQKMFA